MKIVVTGSLGNISKPLTKILTAKNKKVVVISSSSERIKDIENIGATAAIGTIEDVQFLSETFGGADAVYLMIPPNFKEFNSLTYYKRIAKNYREAIQNSNVQHIVFLSSWGAHLDQGTGTILGSHHAEKILDKLEAVHKTYIRPVSIYYNLLNYIEMIRSAGIIGSNFKSEDKIAWVHPQDIAQAVSEELIVKADEILKIRYVASVEKTAAETVKILGKAINRPNLQWISFSDAEVEKSLKERGLPKQFAQDLVAINASISSGRMGEDYEKNKPKFGNLKMEHYAIEFAKAYQKQLKTIMENSISPLSYSKKNEDSVFTDIKGWHIAIRTTAYKEFIAWYEKNLDFRLVKEFSAGEMQLALIAPPGDNNFILEVLGVKNNEDSYSSELKSGYDHLCFNVADLDATMEALKHRDIEIVRTFEVPVIGKRVAFINDPFGNKIEFAEALKP